MATPNTVPQVTKKDLILRISQAMAKVTNLKVLTRKKPARKDLVESELERLFLELGGIATVIQGVVEDVPDVVPKTDPIEAEKVRNYHIELADQIIAAGLHGYDSLLIKTREGFPAVIVATDEAVITTWVQDAKLSYLKQMGEESLG